MAGPKDSALDIRTAADGDLTATENDAITIAGGVHAHKPLSLHVVLPQAPTGTTPDLTISAECVTTDKALRVTTVDTFDETGTYPKHVVIPLPPNDGESWEVDFTVGGTPNYGEVLAWLEQGGTATETNVDAS